MDYFVKIHIKSDADTRAFVEAQQKLAALQSRTRELSEGFRNLNSITQGFGIGIGGQVLTSIQQIPAALEAAVMEGIRFNATLESSRLGIAAVIKQFDSTGRFSNFKDALAASGDAIDLLKEKAKTSPATFEQLVQGFQGLSGAYASAGLNMKQQVDLTVLMSQALAGLGIRSEQLLQESRALVTGDINPDAAAAKILGISKAQVDGARESGKLFDFLKDKLSAFAEAGEVGAKSYTTAISNIEDSLTQLKGTATEELFEQIKEGLSGINQELSSDQAAAAAREFGSDLASFAGDFWKYVQTTKKEVDAIAGLVDRIRNIGRVTPGDIPIPDPTKNPLYEPAAAPKQEEKPAAARDWYGDEKALAARDKAAIEARARNRQLAEDVDAATAADMGPRERASRLKRQAEEARTSLADDLSQGKGIDLANGSGFSASEAAETITGMLDTEAAKSFEERLRKIMALEKELAAARKEAGDRERTNAETITAAREELAIQRELTAGHEGTAKALEIERNLRKELAKIAESELAPAEQARAEALATQTAELQKQKTLSDQLKKDDEAAGKRAAADAKLDVQSARPGSRAQREAKLKEFEVTQRAELKEAGFKGDELESRLARARDTKERELRKESGRIGGTARRSDRDTLGSGIDLLNSGRDSIASPMSDSFAKAFHRGGASELMPVPVAPANAPGAENAVAAAGKAGQEAANMGAKIAGALNGVSGTLAGSTGQILAAVGQLATVVGGLQDDLANLQGQISNLQNTA